MFSQFDGLAMRYLLIFDSVGSSHVVCTGESSGILLLFYFKFTHTLSQRASSDSRSNLDESRYLMAHRILVIVVSILLPSEP